MSNTNATEQKSNISPPPVVRSVLQPLHNKPTIEPPAKKNLFKRWMTTSVWVVILCFGFYNGWYYLTGYADIASLCYISIHGDFVAGSETLTRKALRHLKAEDSAAYKRTCSQIDHIYERICTGSDWHLDPHVIGVNEPGCFVRGAQALYLKPEYNQSTENIQQRAEAIKKYTALAEQYWSNYP